MEITQPRMAVASHMQNDFDTAPVLEQEIRRNYQGALSLAQDFMVWNITKDKLTTRMAFANTESYPPPAQVPAQPPVTSENAYQWDPFSFTGLEKRTSKVTNEVVQEFNDKHGTDIKPVLSGIPFKSE
jgi:ribonuclease Z